MIIEKEGFVSLFACRSKAISNSARCHAVQLRLRVPRFLDRQMMLDQFVETIALLLADHEDDRMECLPMSTK